MHFLVRWCIGVLALIAAAWVVPGIHTLGLFVLLIHAFALLVAASLAQATGIGFVVDDFGSVFWGSLIVSLVTVVLTAVAKHKTAG